MIVFPDLLASIARKQGIDVPPKSEKYEPSDYPHWHVYLLMQLDAPMPSPTSAADNAAIVAKISIEKIRRITPKELRALGMRA
jgi:hypothetical protein